MIYTITLNPALDREMTVLDINLDRVLRATAIQVDYGGKGFNVSRALLAMGMESTALGFMGGATGDQLIAGLAQLGVRTDFVRVQGETRTNFSVVDAEHQHYLKVNEPGPIVTGTDAEAMLGKISTLLKKGDWWVLAGSTPPGIGPDFITEIIHRIQAAGALAILDMQGACLRAGCEARAFLVKPNASEAGELLGCQIHNIAEAHTAFARIHELGATQAVISLGKMGAVYSNGMGSWWAKPPEIKERNPIGAGDAMLAGMIWAFQKGMTGKEVLKWGVASGAAAASLDGTAVGSFQLTESLANKVQLGDFL